MRAACLPLFLLLALAGCQHDARHYQRKHRLYLTEPDLVREKKIRLGMSVESVSDHLGSPAFEFTERRHGKNWSSWTYVTRAEAWSPPGDDDTGAWPTDSTLDPPVVSRPRLHLTFLNGRLVAIDDPVYNTYQVSGEMGPLDQDAINRLRQKLYGTDARKGKGK